MANHNRQIVSCQITSQITLNSVRSIHTNTCSSTLKKQKLRTEKMQCYNECLLINTGLTSLFQHGTFYELLDPTTISKRKEITTETHAKQ